MNDYQRYIAHQPQFDRVLYSVAGRRFMLRSETQQHKTGRIAVKGLTDFLEELFWPNYNYYKAQDFARKQNNGKKLAIAAGTGRTVKNGCKRGEVVHKQIQDFVQGGETYLKRQWPQGIHPFTKAIIVHVTQTMNLKFVASELPVYSKEGFFATAIDQVCVDPQGRVVLLELKCGMANYFMNGNADMLGSSIKKVKPFSNCKMNQAQLQLLIGAMMVSKQYPSCPIQESYVIHATESGVYSYGLNPKLIEHREAIYRELVNYAQKVHVNKGVRTRKRNYWKLDKKIGKKKTWRKSKNAAVCITK